MPDGGGDDLAGLIAAGSSKPPEEVIKLLDTGLLNGFRDKFSDAAEEKKGKGRGRGRGGGRGGGKGGGRDWDEENRPAEPAPRKPHMGEALRKYERPGPQKKLTVGNDKKLNGRLKREAQKDREAVFRLAKSEVLQTEETGFLEAEGREKTFKYSQAQLQQSVAQGAAQKKFSFDLPYGPFHVSHSSNGQYLLAGGHKGQIALLHCDTMSVKAELHLKESIRDVQVLHSHKMFAAAQRKYVYIYDDQGIELHCLKDHKYPTHLDFLPYHYLLVTAGEMADLHYRDISTGQEVVCNRTKLGPTRCLRQNPRNAIMHLGHSNGTVTLWSPTVKTPLVKAVCHAGHVTGLALYQDYMVTSGADGFWKVWDMRKWEVVNTFRSYGHAVTDVDVSQTGLVSLGFGSHLQIWKGCFGQQRPKAPYMTEEYPAQMVSSTRFRPYEDSLSVGHGGGFGSILVPGAGMANFDSFEANPFETNNTRREKEVHSLLEKLQPDSIMLDPNRIGQVDKKVVAQYLKEAEKKKAAEEKEAEKLAREKNRMRGKKKIGNKMKRKQLKDGKSQRERAKSRIGGEDDDGDDSGGDVTGDEIGGDSGDEAGGGGGGGGGGRAGAGKGVALSRFFDKRRRKT